MTDLRTRQLAHLGGRLSNAVAPHGTAYRLGGDEFCVLLPAAPGEMQDQVASAAAIHLLMPCCSRRRSRSTTR